MSDIFNTNALCRCCHSYGAYKALNTAQKVKENLEIYSQILHETFGLFLHMPSTTSRNTICDNCIDQLQMAARFKKQVEDCEARFVDYCRSNDIGNNTEKSESLICKTVEHEQYVEIGNGNFKAANASIKKERKDNRESFVCQMCNRNYGSLQKMLNHKHRQHQKKSVFICDVCQKEFLHKNSLLKHIQWHMGINKQFMCEICGYSFHDKTNLNAHLNAVHQKLKLYECTLCPKRFAANKNLKIHSRLHSGERPYTCDVCHEGFICSTYLVKHKEKHDNIKKFGGKYVCKVCSTVLDERHSFAAHMRSHAGVKPYRCDYCEKDFFSRFSLKRHSENQHASEKFACKHCDAIFTDKTKLRRHFKSVHQMTDEAASDGCEMSSNNLNMRHESGKGIPLAVGRRFVD